MRKTISAVSMLLMLISMLSTPAAGQTLRATLAEQVRLAVAAQDTDSDPGRRRSIARTWGGVGLMAAGVVTAFSFRECRIVGTPPTGGGVNVKAFKTATGGCGWEATLDYTQPIVDRGSWGVERGLSRATLYGGLGLTAVGALLTLLWADVPVRAHLEPGRAETSVAIRF